MGVRLGRCPCPTSSQPIKSISRPTDGDTAAYEQAAATIEGSRADDVEVSGSPTSKPCCALHPAALKGSGPSDYDPEPPPEAHVAQLREQGLLADSGSDTREPLTSVFGLDELG